MEFGICWYIVSITPCPKPKPGVLPFATPTNPQKIVFPSTFKKTWLDMHAWYIGFDCSPICNPGTRNHSRVRVRGCGTDNVSTLRKKDDTFFAFPPVRTTCFQFISEDLARKAARMAEPTVNGICVKQVILNEAPKEKLRKKKNAMSIFGCPPRLFAWTGLRVCHCFVCFVRGLDWGGGGGESKRRMDWKTILRISYSGVVLRLLIERIR